MLSFQEITKKIAETYREDAERLECDNCDEVFDCYGYDNSDIKEEILYSFQTEFTSDELEYYEDDLSFECNDGFMTYRKLLKAIKSYNFN
jgi:hypothetical protein